MVIGWTAVALVAAVAAVLVAAVPRRRLGWTMLAWVLSPIVGYFGVLAWEALTRPGISSYPVGTAFYGFMLISPLLAPPWLALCLVGFGVGLGLRWVLRQKVAHPAARVPTPVIIVPQPVRPAAAPVELTDDRDRAPAFVPETPGWRHVHLGLEGQPLRIGGHAVWGSPWVPAGEPPLTIAHPVYPLRRLSYGVFTLQGTGQPLHFAACEMDPGVWSFATRADDPSDVLGAAPVGSFQYGCRPRHTVAGADQVAMAAVLIDSASGQVMADCAAWTFSSIMPQADRSLFLSVDENLFDVLFRIDPVRRQFRNLGEDGPDQPLDELARALDNAFRANTRLPRQPAYRRVSPNGTIRVDLDAVEWSNSYWALTPRVIESAGGRVLLDLWNNQWNASVAFPDNRTIRLDLQNYRGERVSVEMDPVRDTYSIFGGTGHEGHRSAGSLAGLEEALATLATLTMVRANGEHTIPVGRWAAWRSALVILALLLCAIGAASYLSMPDRTQASRPTVPFAKVPTPR